MLTYKEKKQLTRVSDDLAMPKWKFILVYGSAFGIIMVVVSCITDMLFDKVSVSDLFNRRLWHYLVAMPVGGFFYGVVMHWLYVRQAKKLGQKTTQTGKEGD